MSGREALEAADNALLQDQHTSTHFNTTMLISTGFLCIHTHCWLEYFGNAAYTLSSLPPSSPPSPPSPSPPHLYASISCFPLLAIPVESLSFTPITMSLFASIHCRQRSSSTSLRWSSSPPVAAPGHKSNCFTHVYATVLHGIQIHTVRLASFPSLPTVQFLTACSMQNKRRKAWSIFHMNDVSAYLGRQRGRKGSLIERTHFMHTFFVLKQEWYVFLLCEGLKLQHLGQKLQDKASSSFFRWGTPTPLCLH